jgi:NADPH2:quinone reductase
MRAIRVRETGGPEVMRIEETADPEPGIGEVVVRVKAAGVNPVDTYVRAGTYYKPQLPYTPGIDGAGIVETVGDGVFHVATGDRVFIAGSLSGTYAELALCGDLHVHPLPGRLTFAQGAAVNVPYATAWRALFQRAHALPGETVLVHGASGGVGVASVQIARAAGLTVLGTAGSREGRELIKEQNAHHVFDHASEGYLEEILEVTGGRGVDVVLEMFSNENLGKDLPMLARGGRVVVIGSRGTVEINPRDLMAREATILGMSLPLAPEMDKERIYSALIAGLEIGTLQPVVGQELPLAEAPKAHVAIMKPGAYGKIVLLP